MPSRDIGKGSVAGPSMISPASRASTRIGSQRPSETTSAPAVDPRQRRSSRRQRTSCTLAYDRRANWSPRSTSLPTRVYTDLGGSPGSTSRCCSVDRGRRQTHGWSGGSLSN
ncbi:hypothetical protein [Ornithinimicrobium kibberense]|uniref:hypothetical protein n=1 Tax=Ornithinimicrobium kibberense TaxID=282060 RepID=UPI00360B5E10